MALTDRELKNRDAILVSLALLLGKDLTAEQIASIDSFKDVPKKLQRTVVEEFARHADELRRLAADPETTQVQIQEKMAEIGSSKGYSVYKIENPGDDRTCPKCAAWIGKLVSDDDPKYPTIQDWTSAGGLHPNCRCSLHPVEEIAEIDEKAQDYLERKKKRLEEAAAFFNCEPLDNLVFN